LINTASPFCATPELQHALVALSEPQEVASEQYLFHQGDAPAGVYLVERGSVRLTLGDEDGNLLSDRRAIEGSVLGLPSSMTGNGYSLSAQALESTMVRFVERSRFLDLLRKNPEICLQVVEILALEVGEMRRGADICQTRLN
jgi:CRP-like cAMP-binding protein